MSFPTPKLEILLGPTGLDYADLGTLLGPAALWHLDETGGTTFANSTAALTAWDISIDPNATFQHIAYGLGGAISGNPASTSIQFGSGGIGGIGTFSSGALPTGTTWKTVEMWFRLDSLGISQTIFASMRGDGLVVRKVSVDTLGRIVHDAWVSPGPTTTTTSTNRINDGSWHYLVVLAKPLPEVWVDGVRWIATVSDPGSQGAQGSLFFGYENRTSASVSTRGNLIGQIDEAAIYTNQFLTSLQMAQRIGSAPVPVSPTWIDISDKLIGGSVKHAGRQQELDRMEAGESSFVLDNTTRTFDPTYPAGPFVNQLLPAQMRLTWTYSPSPPGYYRTLILRSAPAAYYRLDETGGTAIADSSGNNFAGTTFGTGLAFSQPGALPTDPDTALTFSSAGGTGVSIGAGIPALPTGAYTVEVWFKRTTPGHRDPLIWSGNFGTGAGVYLLVDTDDKLKFALGCGAAGAPSSIVATSSVTVADTSWHHAAFSAASGRLFLDGVLVATGGAAAGTAIVSLCTIGAACSGSAVVASFDGTLDEAAAYTTSLADSTVTGHHDAATSASYVRSLGFVERYDQEWQVPAEALTTAVVTDGSGQLALADISDQAWVTEKAGVRINHVLDACQWPTALRRIDTGLVTVVAANAGDLTSGALAHLTDVADADLGYFFISDDGYATFHDQNHRNANGVEALATFGDIGGTLPYEDLKVAFGIDQVLNDVTIGPGPNTAIDIDSIRRFRDRSLTRSTVADGALSTSQAALLVSRYKDARQRIDELVLTPSAFDTEANAMWLQVLTVNVGDRIAIIKTPAGVEPPVVQECYVEAILDEFAGDLQWTQTLELSPASAPRALTGLAGLGVTPDSSLALIQQPRFPIQIPTIV